MSKSLRVREKGVPMCECDYTFEKVKELDQLLINLTPKFEGRWVVVLIDLKITEVDQILKYDIPTWVDIVFYQQRKKAEMIAVKHPELMPKKVTNEERLDDILSKYSWLCNKQAFDILKSVIKFIDRGVLTAALDELDKTKKPYETVTVKDIKSVVDTKRIIYASEVVNAFMLGTKDRWELYTKLLHNIGQEYAYNACFSYVKRLMKDKYAYVTGDGKYKSFVVKRIDAPMIVYTYVIFVNSKSWRQLPAVLSCIDTRSQETYRDFIEIGEIYDDYM